MKKSVLFAVLIALGVSSLSAFADFGILPPPNQVPDGGTTAAMLGLSLGAVAAVRRFFRR